MLITSSTRWYLVDDVVELLLHFLFDLFHFLRGHREVSHLLCKLLQEALFFLFILLLAAAAALRHAAALSLLGFTFGLVSRFLKYIEI